MSLVRRCHTKLLRSTHSISKVLFKQMMQVAAFLVRSEKGDGDFAAGADLAVIRHGVPPPSLCSGPT